MPFSPRQLRDAELRGHLPSKTATWRTAATQAHHVTGAELLDGLRLYALQEYGPMAKTLLNAWGIRECRDFSRIVFNLVRRKIFGKTDSDSLDDFNAGFDFDTAFRAPFEPDKKLISRIRRTP